MVGAATESPCVRCTLCATASFCQKVQSQPTRMCRARAQLSGCHIRGSPPFFIAPITKLFAHRAHSTRVTMAPATGDERHEAVPLKTLQVKCISRVVFSDIWNQNKRFRMRRVAFSRFLGYLLC